MKLKICDCCYSGYINLCNGCNEKLKTDQPIWCSSNGQHYCNQDCFPTIEQAYITEEKIKQ